MRLFHVSCRPYSVIRSGLDPRYSRRPFKAVWLCTAHQLSNVFRHLMASHRLPRERFRTFAVDVPRAWLRRRRRGIYTCTRKINRRRLRWLGLLD